MAILKPPDAETEVVSGYYDDYKQTQAEIFRLESRRVRNTLFSIAILLFASALLGLAIANLVSGQTIIYALLYPVIFAGLGLLALLQPMLASVLAIIVFVGIIILSIVVDSGSAAISGFIVKAIIIYLLIVGFQSARRAEAAKKEMQ